MWVEGQPRRETLNVAMVGARGDTAHSSGQLLVFMYICVILLEFGKDRPTRDQVCFLFVRHLSIGRPTEEGSRGNQFILQDTPPASI